MQRVYNPLRKETTMEELKTKLEQLEDNHERLKEELVISRANIRTTKRAIANVEKKLQKINGRG